MAKSGDLAKRGVVTGEVSLDIEAMMGEKSKAVTALTGGIKMLFKVNINLPNVLFARHYLILHLFKGCFFKCFIILKI